MKIMGIGKWKRMVSEGISVRFALTVTLLFLPIVFLLFVIFPLQLFPAEDATILYNYSINWVETGVISYYPGGPRTEGATDFLWMVMLSGLYRVGIGPYAGSMVLSVLGLIVVVVQLVLICPPAYRSRFLMLFSLWIPLFSPQIFAAVQGFSVLVFGAGILLCLRYYWENRFQWAVIAGLITSLIRPDGLVVCIPLVLGAFFQKENSGLSQKQKVVYLLGLGVLPGGLYFLWRYGYFGYLFPLPFYVKGQGEATRIGGIFVLESVRALWIYFYRYISPLLVGIGILYYQRKLRFRDTWVLLCGVIFPTIFYSCFVLEQNVAIRFFFPILLGVAAVFLRQWRGYIWQYGLALLMMGLSILYFGLYLGRTQVQMCNALDDITHLPQQSAPLRIATTEAGLVAYNTQGIVMDLWGLNTPELAQRIVHAEDLMAFQPDLILLAAEWETVHLHDQVKGEGYLREKSWEAMVINTYKYTWETGNYDPLWVPIWKKSCPSLSQVPFVWGEWLRSTLEGPSPNSTDEYLLFLLNKEGADYEALKAYFLAKGASRANPNKLIPNASTTNK